MSCGIMEEFEKFPELREEDIQHLREWNIKEAHLPTVPDFLLVKFLIKSRFSMEKAKKTIDTCFTVRTHAPELFDRPEPILAEIQGIWDLLEGGFLPQNDPSGYRVMLYRVRTGDPMAFVHRDFLTWLDATMTVMFTEPTVPGFRIFYDAKLLSLGQMLRLNIILARKCIAYIQDGLCLHLIAFHFFNHNAAVDKLMSFLLPLMKQKLAKKFQFHKSVGEVYDIVPQEMMSSEYGGKAGTLQSLTEKMKKKLESQKEWLKEFQNLQVDERRRQGTPVNVESLFGVQGSFKKLTID